MGKAKLATLEELHNKVAEHLSNNLDDPKVLTQAITFLKNNGIVVDLMESEPVNSLFTKVEELKTKPKSHEKDAVDDLLQDIKSY